MPPSAANHQTTRRELLLTASRLAQHIAILELPLDQFEDARIADRPASRINEFLPWNWLAPTDLAVAA